MSGKVEFDEISASIHQKVTSEVVLCNECKYFLKDEKGA